MSHPLSVDNLISMTLTVLLLLLLLLLLHLHHPLHLLVGILFFMHTLLSHVRHRSCDGRERKLLLLRLTPPLQPVQQAPWQLAERLEEAEPCHNYRGEGAGPAGCW